MLGKQELGTRNRQREKTRRLILQAALSLFSKRGFEGTVLRDIVAEIDVSHAMVIYHFQNKDNLWREAVAYLFERCNEETGLSAEEIAGKTPLELTKLFIRKYVHYCARYPEHARIMVQTSMRDDERLTWAVKEFISKQHEVIMQYIEHGKGDHVWPGDCPPVSLLYITVSACQNIFMLAPEVKKTHGISIRSKKAVDEYADTILKLFFG